MSEINQRPSSPWQQQHNRQPVERMDIDQYSQQSMDKRSPHDHDRTSRTQSFPPTSAGPAPLVKQSHGSVNPSYEDPRYFYPPAHPQPSNAYPMHPSYHPAYVYPPPPSTAHGGKEHRSKHARLESRGPHGELPEESLHLISSMSNYHDRESSNPRGQHGRPPSARHDDTAHSEVPGFSQAIPNMPNSHPHPDSSREYTSTPVHAEMKDVASLREFDQAMDGRIYSASASYHHHRQQYDRECSQRTHHHGAAPLTSATEPQQLLQSDWAIDRNREQDQCYPNCSARDLDPYAERQTAHHPPRLPPHSHPQDQHSYHSYYLERELQSQQRHPGSADHYYSRESYQQGPPLQPPQQHGSTLPPDAPPTRLSSQSQQHPPMAARPHSPTHRRTWPRYRDRLVDGSTTQDSSYDSNFEDEDGSQTSKATNRNFQVKFGTDMPNTLDLRSAVETCDALCNFALYYASLLDPDNESQQGYEALDPVERANLQKIRSMNTTMLLGLQAAEKAGQESGKSRKERELSPLRLNQRTPSNEMIHELAKAATSIFQLAIRIKAWVGMTPEERELDEEISLIRGKRCLLMDSTLAVPTVDQHGKLQRDWAIIPTSTSASKSFHERQRELEQQRQPPPRHQTRHHNHNQHQQQQHPYNHSHHYHHHTKHHQSQPRSGDVDHDGVSTEFVHKHSSGSTSKDSLGPFSSAIPSSRQIHAPNGAAASSFAFSESSLTKLKQPYQHQHQQPQPQQQDSRDRGENSQDSKDSDVPHQKYRKRAKRTQPPGRCLSCDSSDTPEWRRGPDGARTLCNACGLHYAKLLKRQNEQAQQQSQVQRQSVQESRGSSQNAASSSRRGQLQVITFPLRRRRDSQLTDAAATRDESEVKVEVGTGSRSNQDSSLQNRDNQGLAEESQQHQMNGDNHGRDRDCNGSFPLSIEGETKDESMNIEP